MEPPFSKSKQNDPPTRASSARTAMAFPLGFSQRSNASGSIQARNTRSREAANERRRTRVVLGSRYGWVVTMVLLLCCFCGRLEVGVQRVKLFFPEAPVVFKPASGLPHGTGGEAKAVRSPVLAAQNQISVFKHAQMFGDGRHRDRERPRQFRTRSLTLCQAF